MIKLFVVGFSREMDELQLVELFSDHGLVNTVTIIRDQVTGVSKGYAFLDMLDQQGADRAIAAMNNAVIGERTISVRIAENKRAQTSPTPEPSHRPGQRPMNNNGAFNNNHKRPDDIRRPRKRRP